MTRLHAEIVKAEGATPSRWAFVLHGIFGAGKNWLSFTRKLAAARPEWGFVLPDLRGHGKSHGASGPHDLESTAADIVSLEQDLGLGPIRAAIGHSFGGKVALVLGRRLALDRIWVLDSNPGTRQGDSVAQTTGVLEMLEALPAFFPTRGHFMREVEARGFSPAIAAWLAMSVRPVEGGYEIGLDLPMIRLLLEDFFRIDVWSELARTDRVSHLVVAGRSFIWGDEEESRIAALEASNPHFSVHRYPEAGHWVHVDAHDALLAAIAERL